MEDATGAEHPGKSEVFQRERPRGFFLIGFRSGGFPSGFTEPDLPPPAGPDPLLSGTGGRVLLVASSPSIRSGSG